MAYHYASFPAWQKGTSWDKATLNSKEIRLVALAIFCGWFLGEIKGQKPQMLMIPIII